MTPEQLDAIEKLARDPKSAAFHDLMARQTIPLVKALREALAALEWQAAMTKALSESQERLAQEVKEARAEVERLREVMRQVHALVGTVRATAVLDDIEKLREIHEITKGMVE